MKVSTVRRLQDGSLKREPLNIVSLIGIEFVLGEKQHIVAAMESGNLHVICLTKKSQTKPKVANIITVEVKED